MKNVLLSADGAISVFRVPDEVADNLRAYCLEFCHHWLHESPDAEKYQVETEDGLIVCFTEKDFIDYLNQYICDEQSELVETLDCYAYRMNLPEAYIGLPYFNF